jgi:hypothetical protein
VTGVRPGRDRHGHCRVGRGPGPDGQWPHRDGPSASDSESARLQCHESLLSLIVTQSSPVELDSEGQAAAAFQLEVQVQVFNRPTRMRRVQARAGRAAGPVTVAVTVMVAADTVTPPPTVTPATVTQPEACRRPLLSLRLPVTRSLSRARGVPARPAARAAEGSPARATPLGHAAVIVTTGTGSSRGLEASGPARASLRLDDPKPGWPRAGVLLA